MKKRVLVYLLAIFMVLTVFNGTIYAEEAELEEAVVEDTENTEKAVETVEKEQPSEEMEETTELETVEEKAEPANLEIGDDLVEEPVGRYPYSYISKISIGRYYITGYTNPYATVELYSRYDNLVKTTEANSDGYFSISHSYYDWDYDYYYLSDWYIKSSTAYDSTTKYLSRSYADWVDWDRYPYYGHYWKDANYGNTDYGYWYDNDFYYYDWYLSDRYGCWKDGSWCWYDRYNNPDFGYWYNNKWYYYDWYYNDDYGYWKDGNWYWYNWYNNEDYGYWKDGRWYWYDRYLYNPVGNEAYAGSSYVKGYGAGPNALVIVTDYYNNILGSARSNYDGTFTVETNRSLVAGETLKLSTSFRNNLNDFGTMTVASVSSPYYSYKDYTNVFTIGSKTYTTVVNGVKMTKTMDVSPYTENGRTMLPLRYIADSLGYDVTFDPNTNNAVFIKGNDAIIINLYSREFKVNQKTYTLSEVPKTVNGRIMLPISEIGKALGLESGSFGSGAAIQWDSLNQQVLINTRR